MAWFCSDSIPHERDLFGFAQRFLQEFERIVGIFKVYSISHSSNMGNVVGRQSIGRLKDVFVVSEILFNNVWAKRVEFLREFAEIVRKRLELDSKTIWSNLGNNHTKLTVPLFYCGNDLVIRWFVARRASLVLTQDIKLAQDSYLFAAELIYLSGQITDIK